MLSKTQLCLLQNPLMPVASFSSEAQSGLTLCDPWITAWQVSLSITNSQSILKLRSIESVTPSNHLILCHPLLPLASIFQKASVSFPMSQLFTSGGQSIGASASASVPSMNIQDWFPLGLTGLILQSKELSRVFLNTTVQKHQCSAFFIVQLSHPYMITGETIALTRWTFVTKVTSLLFNMLFRFVSKFPRDLLVQSKGGARIPA